MKLPDDYTVRLVDMPVCDRGVIAESPDGHINVYINARLSSVGQLNAAAHEYKHWLNDDLNNDDPIQVAESRASSVTQKSDVLKTLKRARDLISE